MKRVHAYGNKQYKNNSEIKVSTDNMTVTKADLRDTLFNEVGLNKRESKEFVDSFFEKIRLLLAEGHSIKLSGFGSFNLREKPERLGRNPKTGEEVPISPRRVVTFKPGQKLKKNVNKNVFDLNLKRRDDQTRWCLIQPGLNSPQYLPSDISLSAK